MPADHQVEIHVVLGGLLTETAQVLAEGTKTARVLLITTATTTADDLLRPIPDLHGNHEMMALLAHHRQERF